MYYLIGTVGIRDALSREFIPFAVALIIAQLFFKWGSFSLELIGFIVTWYVLGFVSEQARALFKK